MYMNIRYNGPGLSDYYSHNRFKYSHFYPSERLALELVAPGPTTTILDIGCACGGLGLALNEQFGCWQYTGLEIHAHAAELGGHLVERFGGRVIAGDVLEGATLLEPARTFDLVVSLSALDWNEQIRENIRAAWKYVVEGGVLLMTMRLHPHICLEKIIDSCQSTTPSLGGGSELAPYIIMSVPKAVHFAKSLGATQVDVFGYWGSPSATARTSVKECIFAAAVLRKGLGGNQHTKFVVHSPPSLVEQVRSIQTKNDR